MSQSVYKFTLDSISYLRKNKQNCYAFNYFGWNYRSNEN